MTRKEQAEITKNNIILATKELLKEYTFSSIQIKNICDKANISVGNFYHYFENKQEIIVYIYELNMKSFESLVKIQKENISYKDIIYIFSKFCKIIEELGADLILEIFNYSIMTRNNALLSDDAFLYTTLLSIIKELKKNRVIINNFSSNDITKRIIIFFRGFLYEWALSKANFNLTDNIIKELKLYLSIFMQID